MAKLLNSFVNHLEIFEVGIIDRFKFKQMVKETSTFRKETSGKTTFVTLPHIPTLTKGLERIFRSLDLKTKLTGMKSRGFMKLIVKIIIIIIIIIT
jgi:hypothetical protein